MEEKDISKIIEAYTRQRKKTRYARAIYTLFSLAFFIMFAYFSLKKINSLSDRINTLTQNNTTQHKKIIDTLDQNTNDTTISKSLFDSLITNSKNTQSKKTIFISGTSKDYSITFLTHEYKLNSSGTNFRYSIEPDPQSIKKSIEEILYSSTDPIFKEHSISSKDLSNNFYVEWYGSAPPSVIIITIKYKDCSLQTHMFNMKTGTIIR